MRLFQFIVRKRTPRSSEGFAIAPILYLLGLIGVGAGVLFSGYSQILRTNQTMSNTLAAKNELQGTATTLAATSWLSNDRTLLCPPLVGSNSPSTPSTDCSTNAAAITVGTSFASGVAGSLPSGASGIGATGSPVEAGIFKAGSGVKVLDPWGHYYLYCRWENSIGNANAIMLISAGANGKTETKCGDTVAGGDDLIVIMSTAVTQNRAAVWQTTVAGTSVTGAQFGATGSQISIDTSGDAVFPGTLAVVGTSLATAKMAVDASGDVTASGAGAFATLSIASGDMTVGPSGGIATSSGLNVGGLSTLGQVSAGSTSMSAASVGGTLMVTGSSTLGAVTAGTTIIDNISVTNASYFGGNVTTSSAKVQIGTSVTATGSSSPLLTIGKGLGSPAVYPVTIDQYGAVAAQGGFIGNLSGSQSGGSVSATTLNASAASILSGTLNVTGATVLSSTLQTGDISGSNAGFSGTVSAAKFEGALDLGSGGSITGVVPIANGGTGATTAATALANLGVTSGGVLNTALLSPGLIPGSDITAHSVTATQLDTTGVAVGTYSAVQVTADGRVVAGFGSGTGNTISDSQGDSIVLGTTTGIVFTVGSSTAGVWNTTGLMVGTGSPTAMNKLDVYGAEAIGTGYAGTYTAPTNGLIVQGNVGIGTNNPGTNALQVNGTISATNFSGNGSGLTGLSNVGSGTAGQVAYFQSAGSTVVGTSTIIIAGGAVGIGTANPGALFTVGNNNFEVNSGGAATMAGLLAVNMPGTGPQIAANFNDADLNPSTSESRIVFSEGGNWYQGITGAFNNDAPYIGFSVNASGNTWAEKMRITSTGSLGIGTTSPNSNALVDIYSTTQGLLPPRLSTANETAMGTSLPTGLVVYNTTNNELESWNGNAWEAVGANAADAAGSTGQVQFNTGGDLNADANFFWDNTNKRLGIGTAMPASSFSVYNGGLAVGTYAATATAGVGSAVFSGMVGIGTPTPQEALDVQATNATSVIRIQTNGTTASSQVPALLVTSYSNNGATPGLTFLYEQGTLASPAAVTNNTTLGAITWNGGYDTNYHSYSTASIFATAAENFSSGHGGTSMGFAVTNTGSTSGTTAMTIYYNGNIGIGTSTPANKLDVNGSLAVGSYAGSASGASNELIVSGNVGIGTKSPSTSLHLVNGGSSGQTFSNNAGFILENNGSLSNYYAMQVATTGGGKFFNLTNAGYVGIGTVTPASTLSVYGGGLTVGTYAATASSVGVGSALFSGNVGIATATPQSKLHVYGGEVQVGSSSANCTTATAGAVRYYSSTMYYCDGGTWQSFLGTGGGGGGVTGSGLTNYVARWTSSTALGTGILFDNATDVAIGTNNPDALLSLDGQTARTIDVVRDYTANTAGNNLTIQAGGATIGATDKAGGDIVIAPGVTTGTGTSNIQFQTYPAASSTSTADNSAVRALTIYATGSATSGQGTLATTLKTTPASGTDKNGGTLNLSSGISTGTGSSNINFNVYGAAGSTASTSNSATTAMTILGNGYVGIGTPSPSATLTVLGASSYGIGKFIGNGTNAESSVGFHSSSVSDGGSGDWIIGANVDGLTNGSFGLFNGGANNNAITVLTTGNVGIGTTAPGGLLSLGTSLSAYKLLVFDASGTGYANTDGITQQANEMRFFGDQGGGTYATNMTFGFLNSSAVFQERVRITGSGNVGIGTTSPAGTLSVVGSGTTTGYFNNTAGSGVTYGLYATNSSATGFSIYAPGTSPSYFSGGIGVGTSVPTNKLDVADSSNPLSVRVTGAAGELGIIFTSAGTLQGEVGFAGTAGQIATTSAPNDMALKSLNGNLLFATGASSLERMRISSTGNVGIGTSSPNSNALLDIYSTTQGLLPPRLTTANETAMGTSLPTGLVVYNTTNNELESWNGTAWEAVGANAADAAGSTGQVQFNTGGDLNADANFFWDNTNKRLGIGTATPASLLSVYGGGLAVGTYAATTNVGVGSAVFSGNVGIGTAAPAAQLEVDRTSTATSGTANYGVYTSFLAEPGSASTATYRSLYDLTQWATASNSPNATVEGIRGEAGTAYTGNVLNMVGVAGDVYNNQATTVTKAQGLQGSVNANGASSIITSAMGGDFYVLQTNSGTNTNAYGVYIEGVAGTSHWSLYASDATSPSYFAGSVGIGTAGPTYPLTVVSSGSPSWAQFENSDANTGIYFAASASSGNVTTKMQTLNANALALNPSGGSVGIATTNPQSKLHVYGGEVQVGSSSANCTTATAGAVRYYSSTMYYCDGGTWQSLLGTGGAGGGVTGTGITNYVARWTSSSVLGTGILYDNNTNIAIGTTAPDALLSLDGQSARTIDVTRDYTSNTAGNNLTIQAGGAAIGATDKGGGDITISPGVTTGTGTSNIQFQTYPAAASTSTADNSAVRALTIYATGSAASGQGTLATTLKATPGSGTDKNGGTLNLSGGISTGTGSSNINFNVYGTAGSSASTNNSATTAMTITGNGYVGIGTASPATKLDVEISGCCNGAATFGNSGNMNDVSINSGGGAQAYLALDSVGNYGYIISQQGNASYGAGDLAFIPGTNINSIPSIVFTQAGNVGIGTTSPNASALLDIYSTTQGLLPPRLTTANETSMGTSLPTGLVVYNTTNNELESWNGTAWEAVGANAADAAGSTGQVQFNTGGDLNADANFFWDNTNKRLGIGTATPASSLSVYGGGLAVGTYAATTTVGIGSAVFSGNVGIGTTTPSSHSAGYTVLGLNGSTGGLISFETNGVESATIYNQSNVLYINDGSGIYINYGSGNVILANGGGSVGIGTASPSGKLDVNTGANSDILMGQDAAALTYNVLSINAVLTDSGFMGLAGGAAGDPTMFVQAPSGGPIRFRIGGGDKMILSSSGNVGIGTTLPNSNALLDITSTTQGLLPPRLTTANETSMGTSLPTGLVVYNTTNNELESWNGTAWEAVGANAADAAGSTGQVQFNTGGDLNADANFFWDNTNKRLGIGTAAPAYALDVNGVIAQRPNAAANVLNYMDTNASNASSTSNLNPGLVVYRDTGTVWGMDLGYDNSQSRYNTRIMSSNSGDIVFATHAVNTLPTAQSSFTENMVIRGDTGNVGVGTDNPSSLVDVYGDNQRIASRAATSSGGQILEAEAFDYYSGSSFTGTSIRQYGSASSGTTVGLANAKLGLLDFQNASAGLIYNNSGAIYMGTGANTAPSFALLANGNVGVGTAVPASTLSVYGGGLAVGTYAATAPVGVGSAVFSGYVGIGTTSPASNLEVRGTGGASITTGATGSTSVNIRGDTGAGGAAKIYGGSAALLLSSDSSSVQIGGMSGINPPTTSPTFVVKGVASLTADLQDWENSSGTVLAEVTSSGSVGIGTTNPGALFTVGNNTFEVNAGGTATAVLFSGSGASLTNIGTTNLTAVTGTASSTTFLSGNGTWAVPPSAGGTISTGVANQMAYYATSTSLSSTSDLYVSGSNIAIGTSTADALLSLDGQSARTFDITRDYTLNTAGNNLTIQAGGATIGATDKAGGILILSSGITTGTGSTSIQFQTYPAAASTSTADDTATTALSLSATGSATSGQGTLATTLQTMAGTGTDKNGGTLNLASGVSTGTGSSNINFNVYGAAGSTASTANAATTAMTILGSGYVGIGTTVPIDALDVTGSTNRNIIAAFRGSGTSTSLTSPWNANSRLIIAQTNNTVGNTSNLGFSTANNNDAAGVAAVYQSHTAAAPQADLYLYTTNGSTSVSPGIYLQHGGNVGIGTTGPLNKLDINGGMAIGASYAGIYTAPTNGAAIQGQLVVAGTSTIANFQVNGTSELGGYNCLGGCGTFTSMALLSAGGGSGSFSSWTTYGPMLNVYGNILTDTSGSGTIGTRTASSFAAPTFASTNAETISSAATLYIAGAPSQGTNTTISNSYGLNVDGSAPTRLTGTTLIGGGTTISGAPLLFLGGGGGTYQASYSSTATSVLLGVGGSSPVLSDTSGNASIASRNSSYFGAPVLATSSATQTITNAATLYIAGAPSAGTNVTITNTPLALDVAAGASYFGGSVGVGTATPASTLSVYGGGLTVGTYAATASSVGVGSGLFSGYVGVGTTSPVTALTVRGSSSIVTPSLSADTGTFTINNGGDLELQFGEAGSTPAIYMQAKRVINDGSSWPISLNPLAGNVGVGTSSPGALFTVGNNTFEVTSGGTATAVLFSGSGASLTNIGTTNMTAVTGTPSSTTFLSGNGTWATPAGAGGTISTGVANQMAYYGTSTSLSSTSNLYVSGSNIAIGTSASSYLLSLDGQSARTFGMQRDYTASTAGQSLTIVAGGATIGATDKAGGTLILSSGITTGTGSTSIQFQTYPAAASTSTADDTATTALSLSATGSATSGQGTLATLLQTTAGSGTDKNGGTLNLASGVSTGTGSSNINFNVYGAAGSTASTSNSATTAMTILGSGYVGIGTPAPTVNLDVQATNTSPIIRAQVNGTTASTQGPAVNITSYTNNGASPSLNFLTEQGTVVSPAAVTAGATLGGINWYGGYNTTYGNYQSAVIVASAAENFSTGHAGTNLGFSVTAAGTTALTTAMTIYNNGSVGIATATPQSALHVYGGEVQVGSSSAGCASANYGAIRYYSNVVYYCGTGGWTSLSGGGGTITGSGTTSYVARWTGATALGTGVLYDNNTNVAIGTNNPDSLLSLDGQSARKIDMVRDYTSNTAGNNLTVQAGGATIGATDKAGGILILSSGITTGTGSTSIQFQTYPAAASTSTADDTATNALTLSATGSATSGQGTLATTLQTTAGSGTDKNGGTLNLASGVSTGTGSSNINFNVYGAAGSSASTSNSATTAMTILGNGYVGIGTPNPGEILDVQATNAQAVIRIQTNGTTASSQVPALLVTSYSNNGATPGLTFLYEQGTLASPAAVTSGTTLGAISWNGGYNTTYGSYSTAAISATAAENFSSGHGGTSMGFAVTNTGSTSGTTAMTIYYNGNIGMGTGTPANKLDVNGSLAVGSYAGSASGASNELIVSGNVGIGTKSPSTSLHLVNGGSSGQTFSNNAGFILENNGSLSNYYAMQVATTGGGKFFNLTNAGYVGIGTVTPASTLSVYGGGLTVGTYAATASSVGVGSALFSGNVGIATATPQSALHVYGGEVQVGSSSASCASATYGAIRYYNNVVYYCGTGGWTSLSGGGTVTGTGTTSYVARWTGATALGTGVLYDNNTNVAIGTNNPDALLSLDGQSARKIDMVRDYTSNTAGNNLTVQAGGATIGATDKAGGILILSSGITTGTGSTSIQFQTYPAAASTSTADDTATNALTLSATGSATSGQGTLATTLQTTAGSGTDKNGGTLNLASGVSTGTGSSNINFNVYGAAGSSASTSNSATTAMTILGSGYVGIGTTAPNFTLQVKGNGSYTGYTGTGGIAIQNSSNPTEEMYMGYDSTLSTYGAGYIQSANYGCCFTNLDLEPVQGNVGIGTTIPTAKLHVYGGLVQVDNTGTGQNASVSINAASGQTAAVSLQRASTEFWQIGLNSGGAGGTGALTFYNDANTAIQLDIEANGSVGIGTTNPGAKLDVYGNIHSTTVVETTVGTAIASASTIAPVTGLFHVTGTAAISTITPPTGMSASVGGCVVMIADGAWSTTTSGNIYAAMTATAGIPYNACYDGSKWYIK